MVRSTRSVNKRSCPRHVAIILDGNGRWAKERGRERSFGHQAGAENIRKIVKAASDMGVKILTVYAFSTENWKRPSEEVAFLMELFGEYLLNMIGEMNEKNVQLRVVGDLDGLSDSLQEKIRICEEKTGQNDGIRFNVCINYGGRAELVHACRELAGLAKEGNIDPQDITEDMLERHLYPDASENVDLLIRTGGEMRISNFLLWQISYAEFYFTPVLWPDFNESELKKAIEIYSGRDRRFGGLQGRM